MNKENALFLVDMCVAAAGSANPKSEKNETTNTAPPAPLLQHSFIHLQTHMPRE